MFLASNDSSGFRSLFRYISGSNQSQTKIAMTTPVHMEKQEQGSSMAFVLPKKFDPKSTPLPSDSQVKVYEAKGGYYASMRYSGYTNEAKEKNYTSTAESKSGKRGDTDRRISRKSLSTTAPLASSTGATKFHSRLSGRSN